MATVQASRNKFFHSYEKHSAPNKNSKLATTLRHVKYPLAAFELVQCILSQNPKVRHETLTQIIKRKSSPETREGQYMCVESGQIFDTKKQVDDHSQYNS